MRAVGERYVIDLDAFLRRAGTALRPGGSLLASTHHPVWWGASREETPRGRRQLMGYEPDGFPRPVGDYFSVRQEQDIWFDELRVSYFHRNFEQLIGSIHDAGLQLEDLLEPVPQDPPDDLSAGDAALVAVWKRVPIFTVLLALRPE